MQYRSPDKGNIEKQRPAVLFLLSSLVVGGSERKTVQIANALHGTGKNVHLVYLSKPDTLLTSVDKSVPVCCLDRTGKFSIGALRRLAAYIKENNVALVVCVNLYPLVYAFAVRLVLPKRMAPKIALTVNTTEHVGNKTRRQMPLYRLLFKRTHQIIYGCKVQRDLWCERYGVEKSKSKVIYNGVDEVRFSPQFAIEDSETTAIDPAFFADYFVVGCVGQLRTVKNQIEIVRAIADAQESLSDVRVLIVGNGPERPRIEREIDELGLSGKIKLAGQMDDVRPAIARIDLFVIPSISETFSNAALEAMAMGKVVILSDTGGAREMVENDVDGFVYRQGDVAQLAELLVGLANDPDKQRRIGMQARDTVLRKFTFARMVREYEQVLLLEPT